MNTAASQSQGGVRVRLGCDVVASQDFITLSLFLLLEVTYLYQRCLLASVPELLQAGKGLWSEEEKMAPKPSKGQNNNNNNSVSCKDL